MAGYVTGPEDVRRMMERDVQVAEMRTFTRIGLFVLIAVLGITFAIGINGYRNGLNKTEINTACIDDGGTPVPTDDGVVCIR